MTPVQTSRIGYFESVTTRTSRVVAAPRVEAAGWVTTADGQPLVGVVIAVDVGPLLDFPEPIENSWPHTVAERVAAR